MHVHATTHQGVDGDDPLPHPRPPHGEIAALIAGYLGPVRRAGRSALPTGTPGDEPAVYRQAGFVHSRRLEVPAGGVLTRSEEHVVAAVFSLSSATPHLFGAAVADFERDLRGLLRRVSPEGVFSERARDISLDVWS